MTLIRRRKFLSVGLALGGLGVCGALAGRNGATPLVETRRRSRALGTEMEIVVRHTSTTAGERAIDAAFAAIDEVERL
ncbi:MAG: hypothetical protein JNM18_26130, partial [Planctomycetaceae bacterium]|nr:hypothetical protein [Planctomycetaceae bacterium]